MNFQKSANKSKPTTTHSNFTNKPLYNFPSTLTNEKENMSSDVFYINPLLIENLNQEEMRMHAILYEYKLLLIYGHDLGVYVIPQLNNLNIWHCVIFIRFGLYKDGKFKFTMEFPKDFPKNKPIIRFQQSIYHPLINPKSNLLDMNILFPYWKYGTHLIFTIFTEIKNIFTDINYLQMSNSLNAEGNPEATLKFGENIEEFYSRVQEDVEKSKNTLYDNAENSSLKFKEFNSEHEKIKNKLEDLSKEDTTWEEKKRQFLSFILEGKEVETEKETNK